MRPPGAWAATSSSLAPALIRRDSSFGIRLTRQPPGLPLLDVRHDGFGFLGLRGGIGLGLLLRQLARMHHYEAERCARDPSVAVLDLHLPDHTVAMPPAGCLGLGPPRFLHHEGQHRLLLAPGFESLPDSARARDSRYEPDVVLQTQAQRAATLGLPLRHNPTHPLQAPGETRCNGHRGFHTITAVTITHTKAQGNTSISAHAKTEEDLFEVITPVFAMPVGRPRRPRRLRFVLIGPIQGDRRRVLMQPGRGNRIDLQRFESDRTKDRVEIGRKQRIEDVPQAVIIERGTGEPGCNSATIPRSSSRLPTL